MSSYSRTQIVLLINATLSQLRELSGQFPSYETSDPFIVRLKIMESVARLAFNYSIKVSYLEERNEYAQMAEMLDDVLLQVRRCDLASKAISYGFAVSREYESMQGALDLINERLKTIRVVCFNRLKRKVSKNSKFTSDADTLEPRYSDRKGKKMYKIQGNCWVDENGYRKRTPYPEEPNASNVQSQLNIYSTSRSELPSEKKYKEFSRKIREYIVKFENYSDLPDDNTCLYLQCKDVVNLFNLIIDNSEYICTDPKFRNRKNVEYSFMQQCISKCEQLYVEINVKYNNQLYRNRQIDPTLRAAKIHATKVIKKAKNILCKNYVNYPVEPEPIEYVVSNYKLTV